MRYYLRATREQVKYCQKPRFATKQRKIKHPTATWAYFLAIFHQKPGFDPLSTRTVRHLDSLSTNYQPRSRSPALPNDDPRLWGRWGQRHHRPLHPLAQTLDCINPSLTTGQLAMLANVILTQPQRLQTVGLKLVEIHQGDIGSGCRPHAGWYWFGCRLYRMRSPRFLLGHDNKEQPPTDILWNARLNRPLQNKNLC